MKKFLVCITPSENGKTKFTILIVHNNINGKTHTLLKIGSYPHSDYIKSEGDNERKKAYIKRHKPREDWSIGGVLTRGFWSKHLLWNKKTLKESIKDIEQIFHQIKIELI